MYSIFKVKTIKFNFIMNALLTVSNFLFPLITFPYVSRVLNPIGTGKVAFAYSIVSYFTIFAAFGVANYGVRACAQVRDDKEKLSKTVQEILLINLVIMLFVYIIFLVSVYFINDMYNEKRLFFISSLNILFSIIGVEWLYKGVEQYKYITIRSIMFKFISFILIFILVKSPEDYSTYAFLVIFATVGSGVVNLFNLNNIIILKVFNSYNFKQHIKPMSVFFITTIAVSVYTNVSVAYLGFTSGAEEVGYYNVAFRIKDILVAIITSLGTVLLPRLSFYIENNMVDQFNRVVRKTMQFIFLSAIPLVVFCLIYSEQIILILAGEQYTESIILLRILSFVILIVGISNLTGIQMLIPLKMEKYLCFSVIIASFISIMINIFFVKNYGAIATASAATACELGLAVFQIYILRKYIPLLFGGISYFKILLALFASISFFMVFNGMLQFNIEWNFIISASLFFIIYGICLLLLKESFILGIFLQLRSKLIKQ